MSEVDIEKIMSLWSEGNGVEAGHIIYDAISNESRPRWAAQILRLCFSRINPPSEVKYVYDISLQDSTWKKGHDAFEKVRTRTLKYDRKWFKKPLEGAFLCLAECTAKVIYNSSGEPMEFDEDSGWWVVENLRDFCEILNDPEFEKLAVNMLVEQILNRNDS